MDKKTYPSDMQDRFIVRLPDGMRDRISEVAKASGRSMNAEIVARLEQTLTGEAPEFQGALTALSYRISWLETELSARKIDLLQAVVFIRDMLTAKALDEDQMKELRSSAKWILKRHNLSSEKIAELEAEHQANFRKVVNLMREIHNPEDLEASKK